MGSGTKKNFELSSRFWDLEKFRGLLLLQTQAVSEVQGGEVKHDLHFLPSLVNTFLLTCQVLFICDRVQSFQDFMICMLVLKASFLLCMSARRSFIDVGDGRLVSCE